MITKWFYIFNHYLMLISLGALLFLIVAGFALMPFMNLFSYDFICLEYDILKWGLPIALAFFTVSSSIVASGFSQHRIEIQDKK